VIPHLALIHFSLDLTGGKKHANEILKKLQTSGKILSISSVYKRYMTAERADINAHLEFVVKYETPMSVDQLLDLVLSLSHKKESRFQEAVNTELIVLAFNRQIMMSPKLTLPYPLLHQDPLIIRCAAEAWGQYEHPIYQKNLNEIAKAAQPARQAEFYMQGKTLVDF